MLPQRLLAVLTLAALAGCGTTEAGSGAAAQGPSLKLENHAQATVTLTLLPGWNAVGFTGLPVTAVNGSGTNGAFATWEFASTYQAHSVNTTTLNEGEGTRRGFWFFANGNTATTLNYTATDVVNTTTSTVLRGWNLLAFPATGPVAGSSLVVRSAGNVVALDSVILPQFTQINADRTYQSINVLGGGSLTPGLAYWVFASGPATLSWEAVKP